jgi:hypothetical protein
MHRPTKPAGKEPHAHFGLMRDSARRLFEQGAQLGR